MKKKQLTKSERILQEDKDKDAAHVSIDSFMDVGNSVDFQMDSYESTVFPIVGIGASAGGLAAFEAFFSGMPTDVDPDMAFILVQHLAPDHKSILADLIRKYTRMEVFEVEDGVFVKPNCAYIIPPNRDMAFIDGTLQLLEPSAPRGQRLPIDFFFRSLAQDQRERAICIILSGTGSDGTLGVREIKGEGGMVMVQDPSTTEYDGMPNSVIATGLADYVLKPVDMPAQLMAYVSHSFIKTAYTELNPTANFENSLKKIFVLLRSQTGHDFSQYKLSTIQRRIERRIAVNQIETIDGYVKFLQRTSSEVEALFRDLLIGVTSFFRDPDAFKELEEKVIPNILKDKPAGSVIRIWSTGCSTGEEAYSVAILFYERQEVIKKNIKIQIFATDIDVHSITTARAGLYPASIASDITQERLSRFFQMESDGNSYRIHKSIRDMLIFSEQDLIKDPPFSKLDLLICRNLLIYMGSSLQKRVIQLFYYALKPGGILFLGTSETVGEFSELFSTIDRKEKLYKRKDDFQGIQRITLGQFIPSLTVSNPQNVNTLTKSTGSVKLPLKEFTEQALLRQIFQAAVLVNVHGDIYYLHGRTGMYLEPAPGESGINNVLKMAREGLRRDLTSALYKASITKETVSLFEISVKTNGHYTPVNLTVCPVPKNSLEISEPFLYLIIMEEAKESNNEQSELPIQKQNLNAAVISDDLQDSDARIAALMRELRIKEEYLQTANEELETSNEELKSSNEEMQSVNEELQSSNEELETSKEELQSMNEELATVNTELQTKIVDLSRVNNDMNNLLAGTGIATIFVDLQMRILRFTPTAIKIINLIKSDVGRPVGHIVSNLVGYLTLVEDVKSVLDSLNSKEIELQTTDGKWFIMRILPYRTLENVIEGAVITFVDIDDIRKVQRRQFESDERYRIMLETANEGIACIDMDDRIKFVNSRMADMLGYEPDTIMGQKVTSFLAPEELEDNLTRKNNRMKGLKEVYECRFIRKDGKILWTIISSSRNVPDDNGGMTGSFIMVTDITKMKLLEKKNEKAGWSS